MWDNTPLLRGISNLMFGISFVLILYGVVRYVLHLPVFPLRAVELTTIPQRISVERMREVINLQVSGNFFTVDLVRTRQAFEKLPWVRKVSVRRKFPWSLEIDVEEQVALARWNGSALVNTHGEVFSGETNQVLPVFIGQTNTSPQVTQMFNELNEALQPLNQKITQISLSPRFAWQVKLDKGMVLELGREEMHERMLRFVKVYPYSLAALVRPTNHVDLRYRNGFAAYLPSGKV